MEKKQDEIFSLYKDLLDKGLAKELARFYLPLSTYTTISTLRFIAFHTAVPVMLYTVPQRLIRQDDPHRHRWFPLDI